MGLAPSSSKPNEQECDTPSVTGTKQGEKDGFVLARSLPRPVQVLRCASSGQRRDHDVRRRSEDSSHQQQCRQKVVVSRRARSNTSSLKADAGSRTATGAEEEDEGALSSSSSDEAPPAFPVEHIVDKLRQLLTPSSHVEAKLQNLSNETSSSLGRTCPLPLFALAVGGAASRLGCRLAVRRVLDTQLYWSSCMGSTFIVCALPPAGNAPQQEHACIIISPGFNDIFATPHMTPRYRQVWSTLPDVFVGHIHVLVPLLRLLCYELTLMFESLGRHAPPWRSFDVLASRWLSSSCEDVAVPVTGLRPSTRMEVGLFLAETKKLLEGQPVRPCTRSRRQPAGDQRVHSGVASRPVRAISGLQACRPPGPPAACTVMTGFSVKAEDEEE